MEVCVRGIRRFASIPVALALSIGAASIRPAEAAPSPGQSQPAGHPIGQPNKVGPATRNAAVAELLASGFSSVTALRQIGDAWVGQGVRHAVLVAFRIDGRGVQASPPAH